MKRILSIVLCATAIAAFGEETAVTDVTFSLYPVTSSLKNTIVAISLRGMDGQPVAIANLVKTANLTSGDRLYAFEDGVYEEWSLENGAWVKVEKKYMMNKEGQLVEAGGVDPATSTKEVGSGIWLVRNDSYEPGTEFKFYLYGKPVTSPTSTTAAEAWTLIGNPTRETVTITAERFGANALSEGDQIVIPLAPSGNLSRYTYSVKYGWRTTDAKGQWVTTSPSLGAGLGCWIRTTKVASINWISK